MLCAPGDGLKWYVKCMVLVHDLPAVVYSDCHPQPFNYEGDLRDVQLQALHLIVDMHASVKREYTASGSFASDVMGEHTSPLMGPCLTRDTLTESTRGKWAELDLQHTKKLA